MRPSAYGENTHRRFAPSRPPPPFSSTPFQPLRPLPPPPLPCYAGSGTHPRNQAPKAPPQSPPHGSFVEASLAHRVGSLALSLSGSVRACPCVRAPLGTCLVAVESLEPFIISLLFSSLPISNYLVLPPQPSPTGDSGESDKDMRARARTHKELKRERKKN